MSPRLESNAKSTRGVIRPVALRALAASQGGGAASPAKPATDQQRVAARSSALARTHPARVAESRAARSPASRTAADRNKLK